MLYTFVFYIVVATLSVYLLFLCHDHHDSLDLTQAVMQNNLDYETFKVNLNLFQI